MNRTLLASLRRRTGNAALRASRAVLQLCICLLPCAVACQAQDTSEYALKAAFLFHFAQLTKFPNEAGSPRAFAFCTVGKDPFGGELEKVLSAKTIASRPTSILHLKDAANVRNCSVLFVSANQEKQASAFLAGAREAAVLITVESTRMLHAGAMIAFERDGERLRFQVNPSNAARSGISFTSNLLNLASSIVRD